MNTKEEKAILKKFPDNELNRSVHHDEIILLTNPGDPNPLLSFKNEKNIIGLSDKFPKYVFNMKGKGGKRKTKKTKSGSGKTKKKLTWRDTPFSQKWPNRTLKLLEEGRGNLGLSLEIPKTREPLYTDIESGLYHKYNTPKSILKKGGKTKKYVKNKRKSRKSNKRKSKKAGGPRMSIPCTENIPRAVEEPNYPTATHPTRINPNDPFSYLHNRIYPYAEANIKPYHNPTVVVISRNKK